MCVTAPTSTPLNLTGAPTESPFTLPSKKLTSGRLFWKNRPDPSTSTPATASPIALTTKAPIAAGLAFLLMRVSLRRRPPPLA